jgi:tetratricopeptide (TPR) repeat protein
MKDKLASETGIQSRLRHLPDKTPPEDLQQRIMRSLPSQRKSLAKRLQKNIRDFFSLSVGPVLAMASLALAFFTGMQTDRYLRGDDEIVTALRNESVTVLQKTNAEAAFYLGRSLLVSDQPEVALNAFRQAALLQPGNPQYVLWQGAAYYALGKVEEERESYRQLIDSRPDYLPARVNLAHNLMQNGLPDQAKQLYEQVLQYDPTEKTALYNRALALNLQDKKTAEAKAWKDFLRQYRTGIWAYRALRHLHEIGDYSYRNYQIGYRSIILNQDLLLGPPGMEQDLEIKYLSGRFVDQAPGVLNIVVYKQDDVQQAKTIARTLRRAVISQVSASGNRDVRVSWFGEPEAMATPDRDSVYLSKGVLIFSAPKNKRKEERI